MAPKWFADWGVIGNAVTEEPRDPAYSILSIDAGQKRHG